MTDRQFNLLKLLGQYPEIIISKDEIAEAVWPDQALFGITDDQIYQLVHRVRTKHNIDYIESVAGRGYCLNRPKANTIPG